MARVAFSFARVPKTFFYALGFMPAVWLFWLALTDRIGPDPVALLEHGIGLWALRFLIATLCITPLRRFTGINFLRYRRILGLLAFYYAALHLMIWAGFDRVFDLHAIYTDILRRPYITIGMASLLIMVPLAVTSNNFAIRKLGAKNWNRLHKLVYIAIAMAALHFVLLTKTWQVEPLTYAAITFVLLAMRLIMQTPKKRLQ